MRRTGCLALVFSLLLGVACTAAPVPTQPAPPPEIVIGSINPLTGALAASGQAVQDGIVYAVDEVNASGGIRGVKVRLETRDDESRPERAIATAEELITRAGVIGLVGGYVDTLVGAISEVAEKYQVPYVAAASLDTRLVQRGYKYFFRISNLDPYVVSTTGFMKNVVRPAKVAIIYSSTPGASQLAAAQRQALEAAGIQVPLFEAFQTGVTDFTPVLLRFGELGIEAVIINGFLADNVLLLRQVHQHGLKFRAVLGSFGMEFPAVISQLGPAAEGAFGTTSWMADVAFPGTEAQSRAYIEGFRARYGRTPDPLSMHGYAAARALIEAVALVLQDEPQARPRPERIRDALLKVAVQTPMGRVAFKPDGDPVEYLRYVIQIQDGKYVVVYPPERATGTARLP